MIREIRQKVMSGYPMIAILLVLQILFVLALLTAAAAGSVGAVLLSVLANILTIVLWVGFFMVHPNEAKVLQLFGKYVGTIREPGLRWANPFFTKKPAPETESRLRRVGPGQDRPRLWRLDGHVNHPQGPASDL